MEPGDYRTSLYCWITLFVFIIVTLIIMMNFYNKAVKEITNNYNNHRIELEKYVKE